MRTSQSNVQSRRDKTLEFHVQRAIKPDTKARYVIQGHRLRFFRFKASQAAKGRALSGMSGPLGGCGGAVHLVSHHRFVVVAALGDVSGAPREIVSLPGRPWSTSSRGPGCSGPTISAAEGTSGETPST